MIVRYPTGFYKLPTKPSDSDSVTYIISDSTPPRFDLTFPKIPRGISNRQRIQIDLPLFDLRQTVGDLIYSISKNSSSVGGSNSKQFEVGQLLEFTDSDFAAAELMLVQDTTEIRHDTFQPDYAGMGLSSGDQTKIATASVTAYQILSTQLNDAKAARTQAENTITVTQKLINELNRTIIALQIISTTDTTIADTITKLQANLDTANTTLNGAIISANTHAAEATETYNKLQQVAMVVR